jgi:peptidoglycan-N-acetylglucosamine deacetylase
MLTRIPKLLRSYYPNLVWEGDVEQQNAVYLTFDDGPIPNVTPWVLELLKEYNVKATFFCIGDNVKKHPTIYQRILDEGHAVGNHTFNHVKGWGSSDENYIKNVKLAEGLIKSKLFRPPYGRITKSQIALIEKEYTIIMWSVLTGDYNRRRTPNQCFLNLKRHLKPGSIVVFHDSIKAETNMKFALKKTLELMKERGLKASLFS